MHVVDIYNLCEALSMNVRNDNLKLKQGTIIQQTLTERQQSLISWYIKKFNLCISKINKFDVISDYTATIIFLTIDVNVHGEVWCCSPLMAVLSKVVLLDTSCQTLSFTPVETATVVNESIVKCEVAKS